MKGTSWYWEEQELNGLMVEQGFRLRGLDVTRLETFVDAAFAFVLTLLVISFDELPSNYQEMVDAVEQIPAFAASFAVLMMFWRKHRNWSRRFGLENNRTITLSLMLIFVVLVYVYPLRMLFEGLVSHLSNGLIPTSYQIDSIDDIRIMFIFYSAGFLAMSALIALLYAEALKQRLPLGLNEREQCLSKAELTISLLSAIFGVASISIAWFASANYVVLAGYVYCLLIPLLWLPSALDRRLAKQSVIDAKR